MRNLNFLMTVGSLRKTNKSIRIAELEKKVDVQLKLPQVTTSKMSTAQIFDVMALVQMTKSDADWLRHLYGGMVVRELMLSSTITSASQSKLRSERNEEPLQP